VTPIACLVLAADPAPAGPEGDGGGGGFGGIGGFLPLILIFLIFYMLLIRPQSKERKKREAELKAVRKHDRIVTNAGLHGTVVSLGETDVVLRLDPDDVRVRVERTALWQIRSRSTEEEAEEAPAPAASPDRSKEKGKTTG
jgi:preprotein translocase subunit YajC